ncbi:hypothetical protein GF367_03520 [Candidatus Woesearchaeota archaeon]|nr:hypothetical protein [Candidatus Woesearchaeota archaeon]
MDDYLIKRMQVLLDWLNKHTPITQWSEHRFKRKFAQRSPVDIINDRDMSFLGACFDYTQIASKYITDYIDEQHPFGIQLLRNHNQHNADYGIHVFIPFMYKRKGHVLDFSDRTNVYLYEGQYENTQPHAESLDVIIVPSPNPEKNLFENYPDLVERLPFTFQDYIQHVNDANNDPATHKRYQREIGDQKLLTLKPYHPLRPPKSINIPVK